MMTPDVNVSLVDFHSTKGNEMIIPNEDGSYTVLINSRSAANKQLEAYQHALEHIRNNDFQQASVQQIEAIAHSVQTPKENPVSVVVHKRKRRRRNRYGQYEKQRRALAAFGVDAWSQHEAHWLDPDYRF